MGVLFQPRRPIARWAAVGVVTSARDDRRRRSPDLTGPTGDHGRGAPGPLTYLPVRTDAADPCSGPLARALDALATGEVAIVPELFTADVVGWWPNFGITSRHELEQLMAERDDALADVHLATRRFGVDDDRVTAEWVLTGRHAGALLLGDDVLVEATDRTVVLAGVTLARLRDGRVDSFHLYYDDTAILEQVLG